MGTKNINILDIKTKLHSVLEMLFFMNPYFLSKIFMFKRLLLIVLTLTSRTHNTLLLPHSIQDAQFVDTPSISSFVTDHPPNISSSHQNITQSTISSK